jgi:CBS domain-containing protein
MTRDVITVSPGLSLRDLVDLLAARHIGGAPVVAGRKVVGVVTGADILSFLASEPVVPPTLPGDADTVLEPAEEWTDEEQALGAYFGDFWPDAGADAVARLQSSESPEWDLLEDHTVAEAMSRRIASVSPHDDVAAAARKLESAGVHRLLVLDRGALVGILTTSDVSRAVAHHRA